MSKNSPYVAFWCAVALVVCTGILSHTYLVQKKISLMKDPIAQRILAAGNPNLTTIKEILNSCRCDTTKTQSHKEVP